MASLLERAIEAISPRAALKREAARQLLQLRRYEAARHSRATYGWLAASTSANAEIYGDLVTLRNRSRDLVRGHGMARKAVRVLKNNVIGTGIIPQPQTGDQLLNKKIADLWQRFADECDYAGQLDIYGLQALAYRSMIEGGEELTRLRIVSRGRARKIPLELQLLEGDFLDHRKNERLDNGRIVQGVELQDGKRAGYWLFREHPGEFIPGSLQSYETDRIDAKSVLHLYEVERIGQVRGVPWLTPGMIDARHGQDYWMSELMRKRLQACQVAVVLGADDEDEAGIAGSTQTADGKPSPDIGPNGPVVEDAAGNRIEAFEPGMIAIARGGKKVEFTPIATDNTYSAVRAVNARDLAAAWDVMYEQITGDLSQGNFSSLKAGANEFRRSCETMQWLTFIPMWATPVYRAFIDACVVAGELPRGVPYTVDHTVPMFESVDRLKDTQDDVASIRALLTSPQERIRRRGGDPERVLAEAIDWHNALVKGGVVSDADAALVSKPGAATSPGLRPEGAGDGATETPAGEEDASQSSEGENPK
ncbi:MAG TPA: phage portal protein [Rhizomicrobium sp.]|jgi:lambda family phage portal protein